MLDGKDLILATKKYAVDDRRKSWSVTISTLLLLSLAYAGIFLKIHYLLSFGLCLFISLTLVRLFIIYHDYQHHAILQKSLLAKVFFSLFGLFILAAPSIWKRSHDYHHKHNSKLYTSSIGSFPIVTKEKFLEFPRAHRFLYLFIRHPLVIGFGYIFVFIYGMCLQSIIQNPKKHWDSALSLIFHFGIGYGIYFLFGWQAFLLAFLLPAVISCAMGAYLFYAQHNFTTAKFREKDGWTYVGAAMDSSSYMKLSPIMHWFTGNIGYHHIHHVNARIPFYKLPQVLREMPEMQKAKTTSLNPLEIYKCLRLKVWSPEDGRMLTLKEVYS